MPKILRQLPKLVIGIGIAIAVIFGVFFTGIIWFWLQLQPVSATGQPPQSFVVPRGQAISVIAERLSDQGLIRHPLGFRFVIWRHSLADNIQAGSFRLSPSMTVVEIALTMTEGTTDTWVTIPEGKRVEEIAELFSELPAFDQEEFIQLAKPDEGYLFPDTYLVPELATASTIHSLLRKTFDQKISDQIEPKLRSSQFDLEEVVILASLVEREARHPEDMETVAGILTNRLEIGMALQVDATLQYAKTLSSQNGNWWPTPLAADKNIESPYNTYKYPGLPPSPISNPGLNALLAAADPAENDFLYYISDPAGNMHYAQTYEEHVANVHRYLR